MHLALRKQLHRGRPKAFAFSEEKNSVLAVCTVRP